MSEPAPTSRPWYQRIGPGLITACVVIGPGSILTSSRIGANEEYSMLWVVLTAVVFMMLFMTLGARLGVIAEKPPGDLIREKAGSWLAILVGLCAFFISAAFQSGNNLGAGAAFEAFSDSKALVASAVVLLNVLAISFMFIFKNLYKMLEKVMMVFVALMLICFAINLISLKPDVGALISGLVPSAGKAVDDRAADYEVWKAANPEAAKELEAAEQAAADAGEDKAEAKEKSTEDLILGVLALVGTTFVITAGYYQAYLVRQKGWKEPELKSGLMDARIGSIIMFLITLMLMSTAAAGLYTGKPVALGNPVDVADALEGTFGPSAKIIFCCGLFSAAYSSFLVNSMIGGFILADSLNLGSSPEDKGPRILTTVALLTGMVIGLAAIILDFDRTPTIIFAQAVTVLGAPLIACVLLWLTSREDVMGKARNSPLVNVLGVIGLILLLGMAYRTAFDSIPKGWARWTAAPAPVVETPEASLGEAEDEPGDE